MVFFPGSTDKPVHLKHAVKT